MKKDRRGLRVLYIRLSYNFNENTPFPAGLESIKIETIHEMAKGSISNVFRLTICNHTGTHIDGPNHFSLKKKTIDRFNIEDFIYTDPLLLDIPKHDGGLIDVKDLGPHFNSIKKCDLLLVRTGFSKIRRQDPRRYIERSPGFSAAAAACIAGGFPSLRAMAMDTLSFACSLKLKEGIRAHQILLDECSRDIFLIEDINLDFDLSRLKQVMAIPLFVENIDSAPCTVFALTD
ncbi:MAG: cyclase family protein [Spirochaetota bacterium]